MVRSFRLEDQKNVILSHLASEAFEPIDDIAMQMLTKKTFLIGIATVARVSEIHAIDSTRVSFDEGPSGVKHLGLALDLQIIKVSRKRQRCSMSHPCSRLTTLRLTVMFRYVLSGPLDVICVALLNLGVKGNVSFSPWATNQVLYLRIQFS